MLVPICLMSALGIYLDRRFDTSFWMVLLFFVGAVAGGQNVYRMAKQVYAPTGQHMKSTPECGRDTGSGKQCGSENVQKDADGK